MATGGKKVEHFPQFDGNAIIRAFADGDTAFSSCIQLVRDILNNEGCKSLSGFNTEEALNLDKYERLISPNQQDCTIDFVIGCRQNALLMVEAKIRVKSIDNVTKVSLFKKVMHSKDLLNKRVNFSVYCRTIVLLNDFNFERNKAKLLRILNNSPLIYPMKVSEFKDKVFSA